MVDFILPDTNTIIAIIAIGAVCSWVVVEIFKKAITGLEKEKRILQDAWWHSATCRLLSVITGAGVGIPIAGLAGALIGACAGGLNTTIVGLVKGVLKSRSQSLGNKEKEE